MVKGLLIKDFKLMNAQKNFFLLLILIVVGIAVFTENSSFTFVVSYITFIASLFALSSISYDEFENGNAFMFSLPITRKIYVTEKYTFGFILTGGSWALAALIVIVSKIIKNAASFADTIDAIVPALIILPLALIILAIMLPFQLKFGTEKGRIAIISTAGLIFVIYLIVGKIVHSLNTNLISILENIPTISAGTLVAVVASIAIIAQFFSYKVSLSIMNKKEL